MADAKISELPVESTPVRTTPLVVVAGGQTRQAEAGKVADLAEGLPVKGSDDSLSNVTETYQDLITGLADDDMIAFTTEAGITTDAGNTLAETTIYRFAHIPTSDLWLPVRGAVNGQRMMIKRVGTKVQARRAGAVTATNKLYAYKLTAG